MAYAWTVWMHSGEPFQTSWLLPSALLLLQGGLKAAASRELSRYFKGHVCKGPDCHFRLPALNT